MRTLIIFIVSLVVFSSFKTTSLLLDGKTGRPFDILQYDKVIAYDYNGEHEMSIVNEGKLYYNINKQAVLIERQIKFVHALIQDNKTYGNNTAACFVPHLGIVWYRKDTIVAHVSICLMCNYLMSSVDIPATSYKKVEFDRREFMPLDGFSKSGRKKLNAFVKELDFPHTTELNTEWDK